MVSDNSKMSFSELYDTYSRLVMVIALRVLEEKELAEDAFQSAFISIAQNLDQILAEPDKIKNTVSKIARNSAIDILRRTKCIRKHEVPFPEEKENAKSEKSRKTVKGLRTESFEEKIFYKIDKALLLKSLNDLDEEHSIYIYEYYYKKMSYEQIAEKHGLSKEAAKKRVYRSIEKLKEIFKRKERGMK